MLTFGQIHMFSPSYYYEIVFMQLTYSPHSRLNRCVATAVLLAPAWPERRVNLSAASTAFHVQQEKLAMRQVCLQYIACIL